LRGVPYHSGVRAKERIMKFKVGDTGVTVANRPYEVLSVLTDGSMTVRLTDVSGAHECFRYGKTGELGGYDRHYCERYALQPPTTRKPIDLLPKLLDDHVVACKRFEAAQRQLEDARKAVEAARDAVRALI
jgi:hypothetical protein